MNVGQILETHLGWACSELGEKINQTIKLYTDAKKKNNSVREVLKQVYGDNICRFKRWFINKKGFCKKEGKEFTIEPTDIPGVKVRRLKVRGKRVWIWEAIEYPKICTVFGIELDWGMNGYQPNSPSLDRVNPKLGYIPGNVRLVCNSYNAAKLNCPPNKWNIIEKNMARYVLFGE